MTVRIYRSTDASAPVLSGQAGGLLGVLDAVLVSGYGSKTALGWAIEYTGTNKRVYRAASGNRLRLRVDDSGTSNARVVGYETMSDVDTGTNAFPTAAQFSGGLYWLKSTLTDSTARSWLIIGTETTFYLFMNSAGATGTTAWSTNINNFGDFASFKGSDLYGTRICGNIGTTNTVGNCRGHLTYSAAGGPNGAYLGGMYCARTWNQLGGSIQINQCVSSLITGLASSPTTLIVMGNGADQGGTAMTEAAATYPNAPDGQLFAGRIYLGEQPNVCMRGYLPGLWVPACGAGLVGQAALPDIGATHVGTGELAGKTFEWLTLSQSSNTAKILIETSDTW